MLIDFFYVVRMRQTVRVSLELGVIYQVGNPLHIIKEVLEDYR